MGHEGVPNRKKRIKEIERVCVVRFELHLYEYKIVGWVESRSMRGDRKCTRIHINT